jgi:glycerol uptake facilitator protein
MEILVAEIIGTMFLILLGEGVVANVVLTRTKGNAGGWMVITTGWALGVFVGVFTVAPVSGAHINPAVTIALWMTGTVGANVVPLYIIGQFVGAFIGATLVWLAYLPHWAKTADPQLKLAVFSTGPAIRHAGSNLTTEIIGTFVLIFGVLTIRGAAIVLAEGAPSPGFDIGLGALGALPVAFLVWGIGLSLGGPTGYAINPARDLAPRIAHALLPIAGKGGSDWGYAWIPVAGPIIGAAVATLLWLGIQSYWPPA